MSVRAKFKVTNIARSMGSKPQIDGDGVRRYVPAEIQTIKLTPVYDSNPESENGKFYNATPSGEIVLGCINESAFSLFELDKEYYIDFTPACGETGA